MLRNVDPVPTVPQKLAKKRAKNQAQLSGSLGLVVNRNYCTLWECEEMVGKYTCPHFPILQLPSFQLIGPRQKSDNHN